MKLRFILFVLFSFLIGSETSAQDIPILIQKRLHRHYLLVDQFDNYQVESISIPENIRTISIEFWLVNHVNQPIGFCLKNKDQDTLFQYFDDHVQLGHGAKAKIDSGFKKYWHHFILNFDEEKTSIFHNGKNVLDDDSIYFSLINKNLLIAGMLNNEPFMQLNDLIKSYTVYSSILSDQQIKKQFQIYSQSLEDGILPTVNAEVIVSPFASFPTKNTINLSWETNLRSTAIIHFGTAYPLQNKVELNTHKKIQNYQIVNLESGENYFAEVDMLVDGELLATGQLSFKTAPEKAVAFRFGVVGDTESRPFVNAQLAQKIWGERPDFFVLLGDITDGGQKPYKDQWTMEFFTGCNSLMQRIPIVPIAGNGDADLYWFNQYFNPPSNDGYYKFSWSNADFFILHSTQKQELAPGGKQYQWLKSELGKSKALWKFVLLHHAPYSSDEDDYGNGWIGSTEKGDPKVRKLVPLFEEYQVDMVFFGHLHCYERSWPINDGDVDLDGVVYLEAGGGGGNLENFAPHRTFFSAKTYRGYHYSMVNIFANILRLNTYTIEGKLIDTYEIQK